MVSRLAIPIQNDVGPAGPAPARREGSELGIDREYARVEKRRAGAAGVEAVGADDLVEVLHRAGFQESPGQVDVLAVDERTVAADRCEGASAARHMWNGPAGKRFFR